MTRLNCIKNLTISCNSIDLPGENLPTIIYRYFSSKYDLENFIKGNLWFAGKNQNRFFNSNQLDVYEERTHYGEGLFSYSLSFTTELPTEKFFIKITKVKGFLNAIKYDLEKTSNQPCHSITFLDKAELNSIAAAHNVAIIDQPDDVAGCPILLSNTFPSANNNKIFEIMRQKNLRAMYIIHNNKLYYACRNKQIKKLSPTSDRSTAYIQLITNIQARLKNSKNIYDPLTLEEILLT